jgi:hypothetical protein
MADFIKLTDSRGVIRRVNTRVIEMYNPILQKERRELPIATEIFLKDGGRIDTAHSAEAIDKAIIAEGRIVTVT